MKEAQITDLLLFVSALYGERFVLNPLSKQAWRLTLAHIEDYPLLQAAVVRHAQISKWPPTPAEILEQVAAIQHPEMQIDGAEAWGLVSRATRAYGAREESAAIASLPAHVGRVVRNMGWRQICLSTEIDRLRREFLTFYASAVQRENQQLMLPSAERVLSLAAQTMQSIK